MTQIEKARITVIVDDRVASYGLAAEHGLAVLVEAGDSAVLFDTGQTPATLQKNARLLRADLSRVSAVALSHGHYDHTGGLPALFARGTGPAVYAHRHVVQARYAGKDPATGRPRAVGMPEASKMLLRKFTAKVHWTEWPTEVAPGIRLTGVIPRRDDAEPTDPDFTVDAAGRVRDPVQDDQALWFALPSGLVVLFGCAHAGVVNTLGRVVELAGAPTGGVHAVIGGMHLHTADARRIQYTIAALKRHGVRLVAPCHCTGVAATEALREAFGEGFMPCRAGTRIEIP